ncbi:MAG: AbrB/MazE/SpoVT family DNA-binding domain-containing protein [Chloroflexota bacterium]
MEAAIDKFGRILIPKKVRKQLNLKSGDELEITIEDNRIILEPLGGGAQLMIREGVVVYSVTPRSEIDNAVELDRDDRLQKFIEDF